MVPGAEEKDVRTVLTAGKDLRIPVTEFPILDVQPDGRVIAQVFDGVSPDFAAWHTTLAALRAGKPAWKPLFSRADRVTSMAVKGDRVYALTFKGASRYKLLTGRLNGFKAARARVLVPESQRVLAGLAAASDGLYLEVREGNVKKLMRIDYRDGAQPREVPLPVAGPFPCRAPARAPTCRGCCWTCRAGTARARSTW